MKNLSKVLLLLATVLVVINLSIGSVEGGRVLMMKEDVNLYLESSLQRGGNNPPSPNPTNPASINGKKFAGGPTKFVRRHNPCALTQPS
ncbi:hypothetical protein PanWU01x14_155170 [Parasponia andersonii]|uniref:Transmembrane protein n=1 Tax=Parasponia andersonii TaxID=3476 RepID=A0A2P5CGM3_PARAD|nr:hypothetical protein PanWU01x14_155170 [Parasponia andersonii]